MPVIDVSALEQAADSSNESSGTNEQQNESHEGDPLTTSSPHFITVTGKIFSNTPYFNYFS